MKIFMNLLTTLNNTIIWGIPMIILMLSTGIFLTFVTKGVIFRYFDIVMHYTLFSLFKKQNNQEVKTGAITPFQAVCTALAATVGTGNIVGVAFAIATGGPGAVFWLWLSALTIMNEGALSSAAFEQALKGSGFIVTTGLALFAFATIIAWYYYGEKCVEYLFNNNRTAVHSYRFLYILMIYAGCVVNLTTVWEFADLFNGLMAIPNLIALFLLSPVIRMLSNDFFITYLQYVHRQPIERGLPNSCLIYKNTRE